MVEKYRGDTFIFPFSYEDEQLKFETGDIIRFGIKKACDCDDVILFKEIEVTETTEEIKIIFEPEATKKIKPGDYLIELELTRNGIVETCYRDKLKVEGDLI